MFKLANQVLDAYDDVEQSQLRKVASERPQTVVMTPSERAALPDHGFALSVITKRASKLNRFPIATADDAWLSDRFFAMNHLRLPKVAAQTAAYHIKSACERYGLPPSEPVKEMAKQAATNVFYEKEGELRLVPTHVTVDLSKFAQAQEIGDNYTHAQYVMASPSHVKVAAQYFEDKHEKMPLEVRHKYAAAVQRRAQELGMPPAQGMVGKYASDSYSGQVDMHVRGRLSLLETASPEIRGGYEKLAAAKKQLSPSDFASALHGMDKQANLTRYYGGALTDPYLATFGKEPDRYAAWRYKTASTTMQSSDLQKLAIAGYAKIANHFGSHIADEFRKHPIEIFDSLPNDAKEILAGIAAGHI